MSVPTELVASLADRYTVEREIGRGGMATVYLATDRKHKRKVAFKVLRPELASILGTERFHREIEIVAGLTHPNILPLHDSGSAGGHLYYVMPYIEGDSLRDRLNRQQGLTVDEAISFAAELADALQTAHEHGIVHRDIKPENVLLIKGHALLTDFGIAYSAKAGSDSLTGVGLILGTPAYMSPEQAAGDDEIDARSDVYALGCVLFEMLVGHPPFDDTTPQAAIAKHIATPPPRVRALRSSVPSSLDALIDTALAKAPDDRFQSAGSMLESLSAVATSADAEPYELETKIAPNVGALVSKLCNRWRQVNAFDAFMRTAHAERPGMPLVCVVHGEEGSGHESLVERLSATRVRDFANSLAGSDGAVITRATVPWPVGQDRAVLQRDLPIALFRELEPSYMGTDFSPEAAARLASIATGTVVVVEHDFRAKYWNRAESSLLSWYLVDFLARLGETIPHSQVIVFLKLLFDAAPTRHSFTPAFLRRKVRRRIREDIAGILERARERCPSVMLDELEPITVDDVKDWFAKNRIYDSEEKRRQLAESIFQGATAKPLASVESALSDIHHTFIADHSAHRGSLA